MTKKKKSALVKKEDKPDWNKIIAGASGLAKSVPLTPKEMARSAAVTTLDYVQAFNKKGIKDKFAKDLHKLVKKGEVDLNDDLTSKTFSEIAEIIDKEHPGENKIEAMKALLKAVANKEEANRYEIATHLSTLKELDSMELNILRASYEIRKEGSEIAKTTHVDVWRKKILEHMEWDESMLQEIERREEHLLKLRLIDGPPGTDVGRIAEGKSFRLSELAIKIMDIITRTE